jgi:putative dimethyl sulfoxide reductase chaperone
MNYSDWISMMASQAALYKHLSMLFYSPNRDVLVEFGVFDSLIDIATDFDSKFQEEVSRLSKSFDSYTEQELNIEFAKLFLGPFHLRAAPYGSVYLDDQSQINGPSTLLVQKAYQNHSLQVDMADAPDHIAIELEFIALLLQDGQNFERGSELESFFNSLFKPWIAPFCEKITKGTDNDYFTCLASVLESVTKLAQTQTSI